MKHHIIYVPGIGDARAFGQDKGIGLWRFLGLAPHYHPVGWAIDEPYESKLARLLKQIDGYVASGDKVSLLGFSAGASVVLNAFASRKTKISSVIMASGWLRPVSATSPRYFVKNPAFEGSLEMMQTSLASLTEQDKTKLLTLNPLFDPVASYKNASIKGVHHWRTFAFGHVQSIAVTLTIYAPFLARHIKRLAASAPDNV